MICIHVLMILVLTLITGSLKLYVGIGIHALILIILFYGLSNILKFKVNNIPYFNILLGSIVIFSLVAIMLETMVLTKK